MNGENPSHNAHVELRPDGPLTEDGVRTTLDVAHDVARWNRNRTWRREVACVSHNIDTVRSFLLGATPHSLDRVVESSVGSAWTGGGPGVIWISPRHTSRSEEINTLCHEVAHVLTVGAHGWTWRRMHLMLLPLVYEIFGTDVANLTWFAAATAREVVTQYRRAPYRSLVDRDLTPEARDEVVRHVAAVERCYARFGRPGGWRRGGR